MIKIAAILYSALIGVVIIFQLLLAAGMPWGSYAMGGKFPGKYPPALRAAAIFQAALLAFIACIVWSRAGVLLPGWDAFTAVAIWFAVCFSAVATVLNLITRSVWERRIWAPVSLALLITSIVVAVG
ncbi:MAG: hypothetical protein K0Q59_525 [Paenibacillus sp.]|jgi:hypothetical protein|nr:hypothetical protein [Paenibacillus sp.]